MSKFVPVPELFPFGDFSNLFKRYFREYLILKYLLLNCILLYEYRVPCCENRGIDSIKKGSTD